LETSTNPKKWRVLFDLNVVLDVLLKREPFFPASASLWALAEAGEIEGMLAAHSFPTLFYLYTKYENRDKANLVIRRLLKVFSVAGIDQAVIASASDLGWGDFEDAVQLAAAQYSRCDYLVTRDLKDYRPAGISIIQPADLLAVVGARGFSG
jgi:predicted nucleic acid-binding protein